MDEKLQRLCLVNLTKLTEKEIGKWRRPKSSLSKWRDSSSIRKREPKNDLTNLKVSIPRKKLNWKINCRTLIKLKELFGDEFKDEPSSAPDCNGACCKPLQSSQLDKIPANPINFDLNDQTMVDRYFPSLPRFPCISIPADTVLLFDEESVKQKTICIADDIDQPVCSDTTSDLLPNLAAIKTEVSDDDDDDVVFVGEETIKPTTEPPQTESTPIEPTPIKPVIRVRSPKFLGLDVDTQENALQKDCSKAAETAEISSHKGSMYVVIRVDLPQTSQEDPTVEIQEAFLNQTLEEHLPPIHPVSNTSLSTSLLSSYTSSLLTGHKQSHIAGCEQTMPQPANQSHLQHSQGQSNLPAQATSSSRLLQQQIQSTTQCSNSSNNNRQNHPTSVDQFYRIQQQNIQNSVSLNSLHTNQQQNRYKQSHIVGREQPMLQPANQSHLQHSQGQSNLPAQSTYSSSRLLQQQQQSTTQCSNSSNNNRQNHPTSAVDLNQLYSNQQKNIQDSVSVNPLYYQQLQQNRYKQSHIAGREQTVPQPTNSRNQSHLQHSQGHSNLPAQSTSSYSRLLQQQQQQLQSATQYSNSSTNYKRNHPTSVDLNQLYSNQQQNIQNSVSLNPLYTNQQRNIQKPVNMNRFYTNLHQNQQTSVNVTNPLYTNQQNPVNITSSLTTNQQPTNQQYSSYSNQQNSMNLSTSHQPQQLAATGSYHQQLQTRPLPRPQLPIDPFEQFLEKIQPQNQLPDLSQDPIVMDILNPQPLSNMMYTFNRVRGNIHQSEMLYRDDTRGGKSTRGTRDGKSTRGTRGAKTPTTRGAKNPRGRGAESARGTWDSSYIPAFSDISSNVSNNSSGTNYPPASYGSSSEFHLDFR